MWSICTFRANSKIWRPHQLCQSTIHPRFSAMASASPAPKVLARMRSMAPWMARDPKALRFSQSRVLFSGAASLSWREGKSQELILSWFGVEKLSQSATGLRATINGRIKLKCSFLHEIRTLNASTSSSLTFHTNDLQLSLLVTYNSPAFGCAVLPFSKYSED